MKFDNLELEMIVNNLETKHGISLSTGARHFLITPVLEAQAYGSRVSNEQVTKSIAQIIATLSEHNDPLSGNKQQVTSVAVTRAIHLNFCNIPPFCAPLSPKAG